MNKLLLLVLLCLSLYAKPRVIALSPSINEIIFALGEGKSIVGNTRFCNFPKEAQKIPKVGGYFNVSLEKVISLNPDIVMMQNYDQKLISKFKKINVKTLILNVNTLQDIKESILKIGQYFNKENRAKNIITAIETAQKNTQNIISNQKIMMVISPTTNLNKTIYIVGHNLYLEEIILYSGNKNAYNHEFNGQPTVNLEGIISLNPDIIILLAPYLKRNKVSKELLKKVWLDIPVNASKKKNVFIIDKEYAGIPSKRVEFFLKDFSEILKNARN